MYLNKNISNYFLILFCIIPISYIAGSAVSVANILLIDISFIILILYHQDFTFLKSKTITYLLFLYAYLIFNSFISLNILEGLYRNFGFLRFIILFVAINYFFLDPKFYKKIFKFWTVIFIVISVDVFFEQFSGSNLLGYSYGDRIGIEGVKSDRIVSFFKNEPIVGGFINSFFLLLFGFLLHQKKKNRILFCGGFLAICFLAITFTGERSSTIKAFFGLLLFIFCIRHLSIKFKFLISCSLIILIVFLVLNFRFLNIRFSSNIYSIFNNHTIYFDLYKSGLQVFDNNKIFGVGNKNYRIETCTNKVKLKNDEKKYYYCNTHPHQVYIEFLSEHGLFGTFVIFFLLIRLVFSKIIKTYYESNYLKIGTLIYMIFVFTPIIPSGSFFSNNLLTIFMINLSIFYAVDQTTNVFKKNFIK